jgi:hypothetical protein
MKNDISSHDPAVWIRALEGANASEGSDSYDIWHELKNKMKTRGAGLPGSTDWPGYVFVPSYIIETSLLNREIRVPPEWDAMNADVLSRVVATLLAWNADRKVLQLSAVAAEIARNSWVDVALNITPFAMLPGMAVYIDLASMVHDIGSSPRGVFVTLNIRKNGIPELVFAIDYATTLEIRAFPLNGKRPDEIFNEVQKEWVASRSKCTSIVGDTSGMPASIAEYGGDLHVLLSTVLMACISRPKRGPDTDRIARAGVTTWEIGGDLQVDIDSLSSDMGVSHLEALSVVAHWTANSDGTIVELKCTAVTSNTADFLKGFTKDA